MTRGMEPILHMAASFFFACFRSVSLAKPNSANNWNWKRILSLKELAIASIRNALRGSKKATEVPWHILLWFPLHVPKHSFISWMAILNKLPTRDRLFFHESLAINSRIVWHWENGWFVGSRTVLNSKSVIPYLIKLAWNANKHSISCKRNGRLFGRPTTSMNHLLARIREVV
ncbi:LINE-1 retrotransposable element ORF2 protein [Gossypium australe]|uniref:LINE-1 retrotransposable element ORF2 protein n=1 Tax=Gossypium australe TaxID=47621 RepID=A0A5B6W628_9ROSI|nr:LINE-1 retrotransposable element ORF2 protein [Gossypium australe]